MILNIASVLILTIAIVIIGSYLFLLAIPYSLIAIPYWLFPIGYLPKALALAMACSGMACQGVARNAMASCPLPSGAWHPGSIQIAIHPKKGQ